MEMDLREKSLSERLPGHIFNKVHEAIGEASMCWDKVPLGIFDSSKASTIGFNLCQLIADELGKANK
ncbi:MAG: hypothetical protein V3U54_09925 [Thermodesulfobacteriota bacterium]